MPIPLQRYVYSRVTKDLPKKMVLISGPRQSGKTTFSKMLHSSFEYLNYDYEEHRARLEKKEWDRKKTLIILDEIHKMPKWKAWLKGIYDVEGIPPSYLITGSASLDTYRQVGDSLAGRFFSYRLHPFDLKELKTADPHFHLQKAFQTMLTVGGFPEPYLEVNREAYQRWRRTHLDIILKQDLITLEKVTNIIGIENLIRLLRQRVGATISHHNLANDLGIDPKTVKNWLNILERLYVVFKVTPYSKKIRDSILKAPKYYFFDNGQVEGDDGVKLENLVACALLKELHFLQDTVGSETGLHFLRTKRGDEIDFLVTVDQHPRMMIEVKWSDDKLSRNFFVFSKYFPHVNRIQLVGNLKTEKTTDRLTDIRSAARWLSEFAIKPRR